MILKKVLLSVACAASLLSADLIAPAPARANDAAAAAVGFVGGMVIGGALAQGAARPAPVYSRRPYQHRCWVERHRDRWGYIRERRVCR